MLTAEAGSRLATRPSPQETGNDAGTPGSERWERAKVGNKGDSYPRGAEQAAHVEAEATTVVVATTLPRRDRGDP